ncbi:MAG: MEDS domain-containing protein [Conexivisphaerales archaeon]
MPASDGPKIFDATLGAESVFDFASRLDIGVHALMIYEDMKAARRAEFVYLAAGLEKNQPAIYLSSRDEASDILHDMEEFGIDVKKYAARKMLLVGKVNSPAEHPLGPTMGLEGICQFILDRIKPPFRMVGRLYRPVNKELIQKNLQVEIEAQLNFNKMPWSAICSYDSSLRDPELYDRWFLALLKNHDALLTAPLSQKGIGFMMK